MSVPRIASLTGPRVERMHNGAFEALGLPASSPIFPTRAAAEGWLRTEMAKLPARHQPRLRPCMCCQREFKSDGAHNRLCNNCRLRGQDTDGTVHSVVRGQRKVK